MPSVCSGELRYEGIQCMYSCEHVCIMFVVLFCNYSSVYSLSLFLSLSPSLLHMIVYTHPHSGMLPHAILFLRRAPIIGHILNLPGIRSVSFHVKFLLHCAMYHTALHVYKCIVICSFDDHYLVTTTLLSADFVSAYHCIRGELLY